MKTIIVFYLVILALIPNKVWGRENNYSPVLRNVDSSYKYIISDNEDMLYYDRTPEILEPTGNFENIAKLLLIEKMPNALLYWNVKAYIPKFENNMRVGRTEITNESHYKEAMNILGFTMISPPSTLRKENANLIMNVVINFEGGTYRSIRVYGIRYSYTYFLEEASTGMIIAEAKLTYETLYNTTKNIKKVIVWEWE